MSGNASSSPRSCYRRHHRPGQIAQTSPTETASVTANSELVSIAGADDIPMEASAASMMARLCMSGVS